MATQATVKWHRFDVRLGDGGGSEAFEAPCALVSRGLQFGTQQSEVYLIDCAAPETAGWAARNITGKTATITGNGSLDPADLGTWWDFYNSGEGKNVRVYVDMSAGEGGGYWQAEFLLTSFNQTGSRDDNGGVVSFEIEMMSNGAVAWTAAS